MFPLFQAKTKKKKKSTTNGTNHQGTSENHSQSTLSTSHHQAINSNNGPPPETTDSAKKLRNLRKKLRDIENLAAKLASGTAKISPCWLKWFWLKLVDFQVILANRNQSNWKKSRAEKKSRLKSPNSRKSSTTHKTSKNKTPGGIKACAIDIKSTGKLRAVSPGKKKN